jgi:hypothetical protein
MFSQYIDMKLFQYDILKIFYLNRILLEIEVITKFLRDVLLWFD